MKRFILYTLAFALLGLAACNPMKGVKSDEELVELDSEQIINLATDAYVENKNQLALFYYQYVMDNFPDDNEAQAWANYETGFIHHKMKDDETAIEWFRKVLLIDTDNLAPQILAVNMIDRLSEEEDVVSTEKKELEKEISESGSSADDFSSDFYDQYDE